MILRRTPLKRSTKPIARRKRVKAKRATPRRGPLRDPGYRAFLREEGKCVACALHCIRHGYANGCTSCVPYSLGRCDPAHGPVNGMRSKGPDNEAVPMCREHHVYQTEIGWPKFEAMYGLSRAREAALWYAAYLIWKEHTNANPE